MFNLNNCLQGFFCGESEYYFYNGDFAAINFLLKLGYDIQLGLDNNGETAFCVKRNLINNGIKF